MLSIFQGTLERALQPDAHGWIKVWRRCPGRLGAEPDEQTPQACRTGSRGMCPHTVNAAAARSWHCMRSAACSPHALRAVFRGQCRLPSPQQQQGHVRGMDITNRRPPSRLAFLT